MIFQLLAMGNKSNEPDTSDIPKDPRNQQAVAILFLPVVPLAFAAMNTPDTTEMVINAIVVAMFGCALWMVSMGLAHEKSYQEAEIARKPRIPFKIAGSALIGVTSGFLALAQAAPVGFACFLTVVCAVLSLVAFGLDPLKHKGLETVEKRTEFRVSTVRKQAQDRMKHITRRVQSLGVPGLNAHAAVFGTALNRMLDAAGEDPERYRALRMHLGPYLDGAVEATDRFAALYLGAADMAALENYKTLLDDLAYAFDAKATEYAQEGRAKFDVQRDVLNAYLARETANRKA